MEFKLLLLLLFGTTLCLDDPTLPKDSEYSQDQEREMWK